MNAATQARARGWWCVYGGRWVKWPLIVWRRDSQWYGGNGCWGWSLKPKVGPYPTMIAAMDALESEETT